MSLVSPIATLPVTKVVCVQGTGHVKQVVDEGKVVNVDPSGKVWTPGSHKEIHIGQVAEKPAAHEK